jgi:hypothetical protein
MKDLGGEGRKPTEREREREREVDWLLLSNFDALQRDNERMKVLKDLMAKRESCRALLSYKEGIISCSVPGWWGAGEGDPES